MGEAALRVTVPFCLSSWCFGVGCAAGSFVSGSQAVKQPSSARAGGCRGSQRNHCLIPKVGKRGGSPFVPQKVTPSQRCSMSAVTRS